jgi:hypothetical protein
MTLTPLSLSLSLSLLPPSLLPGAPDLMDLAGQHASLTEAGLPRGLPLGPARHAARGGAAQLASRCG